VVTPAPPVPFKPAEEILEFGSTLLRVHHNRFKGTQFNPGKGSPTRFAFVKNPAGRRVSSLYAAATEEAAIAETLLHDIPITGGTLPFERYAPTVMSRLKVTKPLRMAAFHGLGLRRLKVTAEELTSSPASSYPQTAAWAQASYDSGFDGCVWMSRLCNNARAYVFFGDRTRGSIRVDPGFGRVFATGEDLTWLIDLCAPLGVDVLPPRG
jgi:hypothetical protein